jgi:hypothetical protein
MLKLILHINVCLKNCILRISGRTVTLHYPLRATIYNNESMLTVSTAAGDRKLHMFLFKFQWPSYCVIILHDN